MSHSTTAARPRWRSTGHGLFLAAARVRGVWWVMRLNAFPDHPLWTLFVDGNTTRYDIDDLPEGWENPLHPTGEPLDSRTAAAVLAPIERYEAYGSEVGSPCDGDFCCGARGCARDHSGQ